MVSLPCRETLMEPCRHARWCALSEKITPVAEHWLTSTRWVDRRCLDCKEWFRLEQWVTRWASVVIKEQLVTRKECPHPEEYLLVFHDPFHQAALTSATRIPATCRRCRMEMYVRGTPRVHRDDGSVTWQYCPCTVFRQWTTVHTSEVVEERAGKVHPI